MSVEKHTYIHDWQIHTHGEIISTHFMTNEEQHESTKHAHLSRTFLLDCSELFTNGLTHSTLKCGCN